MVWINKKMVLTKAGALDIAITSDTSSKMKSISNGLFDFFLVVAGG